MSIKENLEMIFRTVSADNNACVMTKRELEHIIGSEDFEEFVKLFKENGHLVEKRVKTLDGYTRYFIFDNGNIS